MCVLLDDLVRAQNQLPGKIQFDDSPLMKRIFAGGVTDDSTKQFRKEFVLEQKRLHAEQYDSACLNEIKTAELQQIKCPQCGYCSLNYSEGNGISLDFPQQAEKEPVLQVFIATYSGKKRN